MLNYNGTGVMVCLLTECNPGNVDLTIDGVLQFSDTLLPNLMYPFEIEFFNNLLVECNNGGVGANCVVVYRYE